MKARIFIAVYNDYEIVYHFPATTWGFMNGYIRIGGDCSKIYDLEAEASAANNFTPNRGQTVSGSGNAIVDYAYQFIGTPYVYGATGPDSFDCSGFTSYVYRNVYGVDISRTTYSQINAGYSVSYDELQPGDLVFTYGLDHVGIYVGNGQYIHAPQPGDSVKVSPVTSFYAARRVVS